MTRHLLRDDDLSPAEQRTVLDLAVRLKGDRLAATPLAGPKAVAVLFDKPTLRTQLSFTVGIVELGGYPMLVDGKLAQIGVRESVADVDAVVEFFAQAQSEFLDALGDDRRPADQGRSRQGFVDDDLACAQESLFLAFAVRYPLSGCALCRNKDRPHRVAGGIDKTLQSVAVSLHVADRSQRNAAVDGRLCHSRRNLHHQARIKRLGNQVLRAERQLLRLRTRRRRPRSARPAPVRRWHAPRQSPSRR